MFISRSTQRFYINVLSFALLLTIYKLITWKESPLCLIFLIFLYFLSQKTLYAAERLPTSQLICRQICATSLTPRSVGSSFHMPATNVSWRVSPTPPPKATVRYMFQHAVTLQQKAFHILEFILNVFLFSFGAMTTMQLQFIYQTLSIRSSDSYNLLDIKQSFAC